MNRRQSSRGSDVSARTSPRLRMAAIVYAVVVILGIGGTGARAMWSQSGNVATSVTMGSWGPQPVTEVACEGKIDWSWDTDVLVVGFTAPEGADQVETTVAKGSRIVDSSRQKVVAGRRYSTNLTVPLQTESNGTFELTVTPSAQGTQGQSTTRTVNMRNHMMRVIVTCS